MPKRRPFDRKRRRDSRCRCPRLLNAPRTSAVVVAGVETLSSDPRYGFMFPGLNVQDKMSAILSQLFRVPVFGRPARTTWVVRPTSLRTPPPRIMRRVQFGSSIQALPSVGAPS